MLSLAPRTTRRDVTQSATRSGGNTATVLLAACKLSLRAWLNGHDLVPDQPTFMEVPVKTPAGDPADDRHWPAVSQVRTPVQLDDPEQILSNLHEATERNEYRQEL